MAVVLDFCFCMGAILQIMSSHHLIFLSFRSLWIIMDLFILLLDLFLTMWVFGCGILELVLALSLCFAILGVFVGVILGFFEVMKTCIFSCCYCVLLFLGFIELVWCWVFWTLISLNCRFEVCWILFSCYFLPLWLRFFWVKFIFWRYWVET